MKGLVHELFQLNRQLIQINFVTKSCVEGGKRLFGVVLSVKEAPVDHLLNAATQRLKKRGDCERRDDRRKLGARSNKRTESPLQQHHAPNVDKQKRDSERAVD